MNGSRSLLIPRERVEQRPGDIARLVVGVLGAATAGLWAQTRSALDANLAIVVNDLPNDLEGVADALLALGTLWCVAGATLLLLLLRRPRTAAGAAIAGVVAWAAGTALGEILGTRSANVGLILRAGSGPRYPTVALAVATALAVAVSPYLVRPARRFLDAIVLLVALAALYQGTALPADVLGAWFLGLASGTLALVLLGAPGGRPSDQDLRGALEELGYDVGDIEDSPIQVPRATVVDARLASGPALRVYAFGRDQRDGQLTAKVWRRAMYREPSTAVLGTRQQLVEHIAYAMLLAQRAGVVVPTMVRTGIAGPDAALLVTELPAGRPLRDLERATVTDDLLTGIWVQLERMHDDGIAHGQLDADHVFVADGTVWLADLSRADVGGEQYWRNRDVAALCFTTAQIVGNERAIAAAVGVLGPERVAAAIPVIQAAALPRSATRGARHLGKALKDLRSEVTSATGAEDVPPLKIKRLSLVNLGMLAGILLALAIAIPGLEDVEWATVQSEFEHAVWGWAVLALILYPLVPISWGTALMGCVNTDLPFVPTVLTQLACSFLNLITPNGIGGTALQLDYLHHQDVPVASAASAMVLSTGVGGAIQMVLFLVAAAITATSVDTSSSGGSVTLGAIALVAALVGVVLFIPKIRGKVMPAVRRAATDIWAVLRNPKKGAQLFGGDLGGNLIYPALLGLCLLAFGDSLTFAQLVVVQVGAGMLGNVAPVPGGIGVQEAALTAGLTAFGVPANTALATVIVFRGITFALPPVFGFVTLRWLRGHGYA